MLLEGEEAPWVGVVGRGGGGDRAWGAGRGGKVCHVLSKLDTVEDWD
jgi:hypothetical protein